MNYSVLLDILKWAGIAAGMAAVSGVTAAALVDSLRKVLALMKVVLSGQVAGVIASVLTVLVTAWTLFSAQGCPWWIALVASVIAPYVPHLAYNTYAAERAAVNDWDHS